MAYRFPVRVGRQHETVGFGRRVRDGARHLRRLPGLPRHGEILAGLPSPAIYRGYHTARFGPDTLVAATSAEWGQDLAWPREGRLRTFVSEALLPDDAVDALMAQLAQGAARAADFTVGHHDDRCGLARTLLSLAKFDLAAFASG